MVPSIESTGNSSSGTDDMSMRELQQIEYHRLQNIRLSLREARRRSEAANSNTNDSSGIDSLGTSDGTDMLFTSKKKRKKKRSREQQQRQREGSYPPQSDSSHRVSTFSLLEEAFEFATICAKLTLQYSMSSVDPMEQHIAHAIDAMPAKLFASELRAEQMWPTLQMAVRELKMCRSMMRIFEGLIAREVDLESALQLIARESALSQPQESVGKTERGIGVFPLTSLNKLSPLEEDGQEEEESSASEGEQREAVHVRAKQMEEEDDDGEENESYSDVMDSSSAASDLTQFKRETRRRRQAGEFPDQERIVEEEEEGEEDEDGEAYQESESNSLIPPTPQTPTLQSETDTDAAERGRKEQENVISEKLAVSLPPPTPPSLPAPEIPTITDRAAMKELKDAVAKDSTGGHSVAALMKKYPTSKVLQEEGTAHLHNALLKQLLSKRAYAEVRTKPKTDSKSKVTTDKEKAADSLTPSPQPVSSAEDVDVSALLTAMRSFPDNLRVQKNGLLGLAVFSHASDNNVVRIAAEGGIALLMNAMDRLKSDEDAQAAGLGVLGNPLINDPVKVVRVSSSSRDLVLEAMKTFSGSSKIQGLGCLALANLANRNDETLYDIAEKGGIQLVVKALTEFASDPPVQSAGCWALGMFGSKDDKLKTIIRAHGGLQLCQQAMMRFPTNKSVYDNATLAIGNILDEAERFHHFNKEDVIASVPAGAGEESCLVQ